MTIQTLKSPAEVLAEIAGVQVDQDAGDVVVRPRVRNPFVLPGSLYSFEYSTDGGGTWHAAIWDSPDTDTLVLKGRYREIPIRWDAASDLWLVSAFTDVQIRLVFNDRTDRSGANTDYVTATIASIDFRPGEITWVRRPLQNDPYLNFEFRSKIMVRPSHAHFVIEVADNKDFTGAETRDSSVSQTNWGADGGAFPAEGVTGDVPHTITLQDATIQGLAQGTYYWRITQMVAEQTSPVLDLTDGSSNIYETTSGVQMVTIDNYI